MLVVPEESGKKQCLAPSNLLLAIGGWGTRVLVWQETSLSLQLFFGVLVPPSLRKPPQYGRRKVDAKSILGLAWYSGRFMPANEAA